jgi:hypothetical protein
VAEIGGEGRAGWAATVAAKIVFFIASSTFLDPA